MRGAPADRLARMVGYVGASSTMAGWRARYSKPPVATAALSQECQRNGYLSSALDALSVYARPKCQDELRWSVPSGPVHNVPPVGRNRTHGWPSFGQAVCGIPYLSPVTSSLSADDIRRPRMQISLQNQTRLLETLHCTKPVGGLTHNFYRYPARMFPEIARELITQLTVPGQVVLDPFMGGGTTVVEALAAGRQAIGIDVNSLAVFVATVKTTPLSLRDEEEIRSWARGLDATRPAADCKGTPDELQVKNLPREALLVFARLLHAVNHLRYPRQQRFARCCLLRLGQWAIDGKATFPDQELLHEKLCSYIEEMLAGLRELVAASQTQGIRKRQITSRRVLMLRSAAGAEQDDRLHAALGKPGLVLTSPPYPGVHVLYHRWQVAARRETPAPYWFVGTSNGQGASHYTLGSRTKFGLRKYFDMITAVYQSVRSIAAPAAPLVQLVSFSNVAEQLPAFLQAMELAGYEETFPLGTSRARLWRMVPGRRWYSQIGAAGCGGQELLLFHCPRGAYTTRR